MKALRVLPEAELEIAEAIDYYEQQSTQLALRFVDELNQAIRKVHSNPNHSATYFKKFRRKNFVKFPYAVVFRVNEREVLIQAVTHAKRHPTYWSERK